jgi:prephenate dehydrogenase
MIEQLGLIGCGLMGGSLALALKRAGLVKKVVGYSLSPSSSDRARQLGVIDVAAPSALMAAAGSDVVVLAIPVTATETTLRAIRPVIETNTLVMDMGSTKRDVVDAARRALREQVGHFVPAHPIAGRELSGVDHAIADLYHERQVILTPIERTHTALTDRAQALWEALGCHVRRMSPEAHDAAYAAVSHLPHLLAFAAINAIQRQPEAPEFLELAGPGFRDFTRIAASDPHIWRDILLSNREELLGQIQHFEQALKAFSDALQQGRVEAITDLVSEASRTRSQWRMHNPKQAKPV